MEINQTARRQNPFIRNPKGSLVLNRSPEVQLYLECSSLNVKENDFYISSQKKIANVIQSASNCSPQFVFGLSKFLSDSGLKLSPVVLIGALNEKGVKFGELHNRQRVKQIFNTPQRIAECIALNNMNCITLHNSLKTLMRDALQDMNSYTLRKNKMLNRKIKLKDIIKLLRPQPQHANLSEIYKDIIENGPLSKLKDDETLVSMKSSKKTNTEKIDYYKQNITTIPINMLIRNLKFIVEHADFKTDAQLQQAIVNRLNSLDEKSMRYVNIFDLIEVCYHVPQMEKAMFTVINNHLTSLKEKFRFSANGTVLFDFSESMNGQGMEYGIKWLIIMGLLFDKLDLRVFSDTVRTEDLNGQIQDIKKGQLKRAHDVILQYQKQWTGGTALLQSASELIAQKPEIQNLIVISDEVSWKEGEYLTAEISALAQLLQTRNTILINPVVTKGTVFKQNLIAMGGISPNMLYNIFLGLSTQEFVFFITHYE